MRKRSAGILMYRFVDGELEVLLAHPGGPFYKNKDNGVWSIPKGEFADEEDSKQAAIREFKEELGVEVSGRLIELKPVIQKSGKQVIAWAVEGSFNPALLVSNTFPMEWPPKSGSIKEFVEVDRVEWFSLNDAATKIIPGQTPILFELQDLITEGRN